MNKLLNILTYSLLVVCVLAFNYACTEYDTPAEIADDGTIDTGMFHELPLHYADLCHRGSISGAGIPAASEREKARVPLALRHRLDVVRLLRGMCGGVLHRAGVGQLGKRLEMGKPAGDRLCRFFVSRETVGGFFFYFGQYRTKIVRHV